MLLGQVGGGLLSTARYTVGLSKLQQKLPTQSSRDEVSEEGEETRGEWEEEWSMLTSGDRQALSS